MSDSVTSNGHPPTLSGVTFRPVVINALYTGIERGLSADILASRALQGQALSVCSSLIVAGHGRVTDVLAVPSDTIDAQLQHVLETTRPTGVKIGIVGDAHAVNVIFRRLEEADLGPVILDLTLSGPSGEDIIDERGLEALKDRLDRVDLVLVRRHDAALVAGMEINSLDDAQVAVQRLHKLGAREVVLRCGRLPTRFFDDTTDLPDFVADLYYDGEEFGLFEAPYLNVPNLHGASSALTMALVKELTENKPMVEALQQAKAYVAESLKHSHEQETPEFPAFFWNYEPI